MDAGETSINPRLSGDTGDNPDTGFTMSHLSDEWNYVYHGSNNTGPGYGRPGAPAHLDPGSEDAPLRPQIRDYARNLAYFAVEYGSTKASMRGPCGANRRWVKKCGFGYWGDGWVQGFVSQAFGLQYPRAIVEGPSGYAYSVDGHFWKAYGRLCSLGGNVQNSYVWLGRPTSEDEPFSTNKFRQYFQGGTITNDYSNPGNVVVTVSVNGVGSCTFNGVLDTNNDRCYDARTDTYVNTGDLFDVAHNFALETELNYNDRYDTQPDGAVNILDLDQLASQFGLICT